MFYTITEYTRSTISRGILILQSLPASSA